MPEQTLTQDQSPPPPVAHKRKRVEYIAEGFRNKTKGEGIFNFFTYTVIGGLGVTGVSVFITWLLRDSHWLSNRYQKFVESVAAKVSGNPKSETADSAMTIAALFLGGSIVSIFPVKWLEDAKPTIVKWLDHLFYSEEQIVNDPTVVTAHRKLDEMPKQTWWSVINSRVLSFVATFAAFGLIGSNKSPGAKLTGQSIDKMSIKVGRRVDRLLNAHDPSRIQAIDHAIAANQHHGDFNRIKGGAYQVLREGPHPDRLTSRVISYLTLDGLYTVVTANAHFFFTRILGALMGKESTPESKPVPAHPVAHMPPPTDDVEKADIPSTHITQAAHATRVAPSAALDCGDQHLRV